MVELEPRELLILRPEDTRRIKIGEMKRRLAKELKVPLDNIGHCVDGERHPELGVNTGFQAVTEKENPRAGPVLVLIRNDGGQDLVPHTYLGSRPHAFKASRFVHFFLKRERQTPAP